MTRLPAWAQFLLLWALASGVMLALSACQINEYHATGRNSRIVLDNGSGTQERGRQNVPVLNPDVEAGDVGLPTGL